MKLSTGHKKRQRQILFFTKINLWRKETTIAVIGAHSHRAGSAGPVRLIPVKVFIGKFDLKNQVLTFLKNTQYLRD